MMKIVAKSVRGKEFLYSARSAHQVKGLTAEKMAEFLNAQKHDLSDGEVWHVHEVGPYDNAYSYAETQVFEKKCNGKVTQRFRMRG